MKYAKAQLAIVATCFIAGQGTAYERETHEYLSSIALDRSAISAGLFGSSVLSDIGAPPAGTLAYTASNGVQNQSIDMLIRFGANTEDDGIKPLTHFFDPQYNNFQGTALSLGEETFGIPIVLAQNTSPDWAIEDAGERFVDITDSGITVAGPIDQEFSYHEARKYFRNALVGSSPDFRLQNMGLMFESLGHVIHHVQDMAQPQHVRNDPHIPLGSTTLKVLLDATGIQPIDASIYEGFTLAEYPTKAALV